ncbi:general transcription factor IIE subunit 2-like [Dendronephthya gigantea]|uniref:general transcription factor IIE subunit 2-like n=1 Tax=Dendronephthya gigantea TaxID=151771 RepID=UPI00106D9A19|nr:general transcription factor IIE subunit 2-like [Dendronephthya gigantea]
MDKMDPKLLKEHASFKKRSLLTPSVESKKSKDKAKEKSKSFKDDSSKKSQKRTFSSSFSQPKKTPSSYDYKTVTLRPKNRFAVLASIIDAMKKRHLDGEFDPLSLDEILDRIKYTDIDPNDKSWLANQALRENEKLTCKAGKFVFKPIYNMKNKKQFLDVLQRHYNEGMGGMLFGDVEESLPSAERIVRSTMRKGHVLTVTRSTDKKIVLLHNDVQHWMDTDAKFKELWHHSSVEGMGETDIERYLVNHGYSAMKDSALRKPLPPAQKKRGNRKKNNFKVQNVHLEQGLLKDFNNIQK